MVELLIARSILRIHCCRQAHSILESRSPNNSMDMCRNGAWADDGIATLDGQRLAVDREDLAMSETDQRQRQSRQERGV